MYIRVKHHYSAVNGCNLKPGVYAIDDPALFGLAEHLVANGHAEETSAPETFPAEPEQVVEEPAIMVSEEETSLVAVPVEPLPTEQQLYDLFFSWSKKQLAAFAESVGVAIPDRASHQAYVGLLTDWATHEQAQRGVALNIVAPEV